MSYTKEIAESILHTPHVMTFSYMYREKMWKTGGKNTGYQSLFHPLT